MTIDMNLSVPVMDEDAEMAADALAVGVAAVTVARMRNGEMPLFLTSHEVMSMFQPFDDDRENVRLSDECWCDAAMDPSAECECEDMDEMFSENAENDEDFWDRKYDECYGDMFYDMLANGVENPVSLQWYPSLIGKGGRPEILGGHHRTIFMYRHKPHALMPVAFFEDTYAARDALGYAY